MEGGGFEPPKLSRQIYSLIPLATREPLQGRNKNTSHSLTTQQTLSRCNGAGGGNRTPDLLITSQLLYLLSYASALTV